MREVSTFTSGLLRSADQRLPITGSFRFTDQCDASRDRAVNISRVLFNARESGLESSCDSNQRIEHAVAVTQHGHKTYWPVNSDGKFFTPMAETLKFCG